MDSRLASTEEREIEASIILEVTRSLGEGAVAVTFLALGRVHALTRSQLPLRGAFKADMVAKPMEVNYSSVVHWCVLKLYLLHIVPALGLHLNCNLTQAIQIH